MVTGARTGCLGCLFPGRGERGLSRGWGSRVVVNVYYGMCLKNPRPENSAPTKPAPCRTAPSIDTPASRGYFPTYRMKKLTLEFDDIDEFEYYQERLHNGDKYTEFAEYMRKLDKYDGYTELLPSIEVSRTIHKEILEEVVRQTVQLLREKL